MFGVYRGLDWQTFNSWAELNDHRRLRIQITNCLIFIA